MLEFDHHIHLSGSGSYVPERIVSNEALQDMVLNYDTSSGDFPEWVDRVTHIRERRYLDWSESAGEMAREACRIALDESGVDPAQIDLFIMATFTTKNVYPGEQTMLVSEMGMDRAATFYLTAGCAGAVYGLQVANAFLRAGIYRNALVVATEHLTNVVDYGDPVTAIIFGDGAGAAVLSRSDEPGPGGVGQRCVLASNYVPGNIMMDNNNAPPPARVFRMDDADGTFEVVRRDYLKMAGGPRVLRTAVNAMTEATVESLGFTMKDLKEQNPELRALLDRVKIAPHQANGRIIDGLRDKLGVRDEQVLKTIYLYGNVSCASNLITLDYGRRVGSMKRITGDGPGSSIEVDESVRIRSGDIVAMPTVGAGYLTGCFTYMAE